MPSCCSLKLKCCCFLIWRNGAAVSVLNDDDDNDDKKYVKRIDESGVEHKLSTMWNSAYMSTLIEIDGFLYRQQHSDPNLACWITESLIACLSV